MPMDADIPGPYLAVQPCYEYSCTHVMPPSFLSLLLPYDGGSLSGGCGDLQPARTGQLDQQSEEK